MTIFMLIPPSWADASWSRSCVVPVPRSRNTVDRAFINEAGFGRKNEPRRCEDDPASCEFSTTAKLSGHTSGEGVTLTWLLDCAGCGDQMRHPKLMRRRTTGAARGHRGDAQALVEIGARGIVDAGHHVLNVENSRAMRGDNVRVITRRDRRKGVRVLDARLTAVAVHAYARDSPARKVSGTGARKLNPGHATE